VQLQVVVFAILALLLIFAFLWQPTGIWASNPIFTNLTWIVPLFIVLELAETIVMLRKFQSKERALESSLPNQPR